jgi:hypothetical protein
MVSMEGCSFSQAETVSTVRSGIMRDSRSEFLKISKETPCAEGAPPKMKISRAASPSSGSEALEKRLY